MNLKPEPISIVCPPSTDDYDSPWDGAIFILTDGTLWLGPRKSPLAGRPDVVPGSHGH